MPLSTIDQTGINFLLPLTGVTDGSNAASGIVGEYISSFIAGTSAVALTSSGANNTITSVLLTAGDWDVQGGVGFTQLSTTPAVLYTEGAVTTSTTIGASNGVFCMPWFNNNIVSVVDVTMPLPIVRYSFTTSTNVYLILRCSYSGGSVGGYGYIRARRVR